MIVLAAVTGLSGVGAAQQEQWLGYRTSANADRVAGATPGQPLELSNLKPGDLALPESAGADALLAKWKTPMVPAGFLWVALGRSGEGRAYDRLFIDSNADGRLKDESAVRASRSLFYKGLQSAEFRLVKLVLPGQDGPITYHLDFRLWISGAQRRRLVAKAAGWYEGTVRIGGRKYSCVLFDANANGAFNDAFADFRLSDRIKIDPAGGFGVGRVGRYIQVAEELYALSVAPDGCYVRFSRPKDISLGTVRVAGGVGRFSAGGDCGLLFVPVKQGRARMPIGKYQLHHWEIRRKDESGAVWDLVATTARAGIAFKVAADKPTVLDIGEPLTVSVSAARPDVGMHRFGDPKLTGRSGEHVALTRAGQRPPLPVLDISNVDRSYSRRFTFEYG